MSKLKKIHFGPGPYWGKVKESKNWYCLDADPNRATDKNGVMNFNTSFEKLPFDGNSCEAIYASHTLEHINPGVLPKVLKECYRVLNTNGCIRIVVPDPLKSIKHYLEGNKDFDLFKRRANSPHHRKLLGGTPTLFELMRLDFISLSAQPILGKYTLAHQNAWDPETMFECLKRAGFKKENIHQVDFKISKTSLFNFEGTYPSEANEKNRSQYFEAIK